MDVVRTEARKIPNKVLLVIKIGRLSEIRLPEQSIRGLSPVRKAFIWQNAKRGPQDLRSRSIVKNLVSCVDESWM